MSPGWRADAGWTGHWDLPELVRAPISERHRGALVALAEAGMGPRKLADALRGAERWDDVTGEFASRSQTALRGLRRIGARALVPSDEEYPDELTEIDAPPPLLFVRGESLGELRPAVALVGARACTVGAMRFAERLGATFAGAGLVVVSGLARGIDVAAHLGALGAGRTIAVLGTGIDVAYPPEHDDLALRIASNGAVVTEFPPGVGPRAWHFPSRNRIISGLSIAVVVVEAGLRSGALITAGFALDQGREVFACTTGPENPVGSGTRELLKDGARIIVDPEQALADVLDIARAHGFEGVGSASPTSLDGELALVYAATAQPASSDDISATTHLETKRVTTALAELELDGLVECVRGSWRRVER
ncbi:MAG TPA: DNA-processing protein DprA [Actinomycetota bacterium]|jgi:DNA processing protein|nr:DNA-processing protein DprA [Actinomycetota bacterium]